MTDLLAWAKDNGYTFEWAEDWDLPHSHAVEYGSDAYPDGNPDTCEGCIMYDAEGDVVASLYCIDDATEDYRREIEGELAWQAHAAWSVEQARLAREQRRARSSQRARRRSLRFAIHP